MTTEHNQTRLTMRICEAKNLKLSEFFKMVGL